MASRFVVRRKERDARCADPPASNIVRTVRSPAHLARYGSVTSWPYWRRGDERLWLLPQSLPSFPETPNCTRDVRPGIKVTLQESVPVCASANSSSRCSLSTHSVLSGGQRWRCSSKTLVVHNWPSHKPSVCTLTQSKTSRMRFSASRSMPGA
jgi:hypothetical protein